MNNLSFRRLLVFLLVLVIGISVCNAQAFGDRAPKPEKKGLFGMFSGKKSSGKVNAPKKVSQVKKEQAKKKQKADAAYAKSIEESKKRTIKIQTPDVQERMKMNQKEIADREKAKKKKTSDASKRAARKFKK
jgi:hypothetical protein